MGKRDGEDRMNYSKWTGEYYEDINLTRIYELLESLGMELAEEERELLDGTSELYKSNDKNSISV